MMQVRKRTQLAIIAVLLLFLAANRGAYKGYFQDDDLDNLSWTWQVSAGDFLQGLATPVFSRNNFRPVGHLFFHVLEPVAGLSYPPYVAIIQAIHLLNAALLWLLLRRFGLRWGAAVAAVIFFLFNPATFDVYWRPMYVFDLLCGSFCLASLLAYTHRRLVLSFLFFWLAYKAKELAIMLPVVLAFYEFRFGQKRWKPLVPFFLVSLSFGIQALLANRQTHDAYTIQLTWAGVLATAQYYLSSFHMSLWLLAPILLTMIILRDGRAWFGLLGALVLMSPLLMLPNRLFSVYLYVPLICLAIALAAILERMPRWVPAVFALCWISLAYLQLRHYRASTLDVAQQNRAYVESLARGVKASPKTAAFVYDGTPAAMNPWGVAGAVHYLTRNPASRVAALDSEEGKAILHEPEFAVLAWDGSRRQLDFTRHDPDDPDRPYINVSRDACIWQFGDGWFPRENAFRWTKPVATATLLRPEGALVFEIYVNVSPVQIQAAGYLSVEVLVAGESIGIHEFVEPGWQKVRFDVPPAPRGIVPVELRSSPPYQPVNDPRTLGAAIGGFGFLP
jgi:Predicted membrane protein